MPDENRVAGIADALERDDSEESQESSESCESRDSQDSAPGQGPSQNGKGEASAFSASASEKTTVYGTETTISSYKRTISIAAGSAEASGLKDVTAREVHNAILQLGIEDTDAIVEKIEEERVE